MSDGEAKPSGDSVVVSPFPGLRDLYLLVAGILVGVACSQAVLGRVAPGLYERVFHGGLGEAALAVAREDRAIEQELVALGVTGVTGVALDEHRARRVEETLALRWQAEREQQAQAGRVMGWLTGLMLAVAGVMVAEALVSPSARPWGRAVVSPALGRLVTARYGLLAVWLAVAVAQAGVLRGTPWVFAGLALAVALGAAMLPLGRRT